MLSSLACGTPSIAVFSVCFFLRNSNRVYLLAYIFIQHHIIHDNMVLYGLPNLVHNINETNNGNHDLLLSALCTFRFKITMQNDAILFRLCPNSY